MSTSGIALFALLVYSVLMWFVKRIAAANIPILAMTANAFKEDERAVLEAGMQAHIAKPVDVDLLLQTLASVLQMAEEKSK